MDIAYALLAILVRGRGHGYDLRHRLEAEFGPGWRVDFGQLYRVLGEMQRRGWVTVRVEPGRGGPARKVYAATRAGRTAIDRWARLPGQGQKQGRDLSPVRFLCVRQAGALSVVGSDDVLLNLLQRHLAGARPAVRLSTTPVGSLGGLLALRDGRADLAGVHLLDVDSGEYNIPFLKHLLPEDRVILVQLAWREQGLLVAPGNPKGIRGVRELARRDVRLVNRQRGAGTRLFLLQRLRQARIDPASIDGYEREETTHAAVAAAIAAGNADVGPGIRAVADARGLEFIPLGEERYDLAIPQRAYDSRALQPLLEALHDGQLRSVATSLPGYDAGRMGRIVARVN